jgi:lysophospholipase L1-like esterase
MRIAFVGDSLTEGWPGEPYLEVLAQLVPGDELLNHGRAGDTIPAVDARLRVAGLERVDLAFVWAGVNDAFIGGWSLGREVSGAAGGGGGGGACRRSSPTTMWTRRSAGASVRLRG